MKYYIAAKFKHPLLSGTLSIGCIYPDTVLLFNNEEIVWLECNGQSLVREEFPELFAIISEQFGAGDGQKTFNLPSINSVARNQS